MDMKGLSNYAISIHMDGRPQSKKVSLVFRRGWFLTKQQRRAIASETASSCWTGTERFQASIDKYSVLMIQSFTKHR